MDTLEFFRAILPENERYYLAHFADGKPYPLHTLYPDLETFAKYVVKRDESAEAVYHACASYKEAFVMLPDPKKPGEMKKYYRVAENMGRMKAFWIDIDCGAEKAAAVPPKGYATKSDARDAVVAFCDKLGLPYPLIVSSGGGLHCYWPLTQPIGPKSWAAVAGVLKSVLNQHGVLQDLTRTADAASILRPPGTTNRKDPNNPRLVRVIYPGQGAIDPKEFAGKLQSVSKSTGFSEQVYPSFLAPAAATNALAEHAKYDGPASSAEVVAEHCQQVRFVRDTQGDGTYEVWRGVIGIIKHCSEGEALAETWSENREATGHESFDWKRRYDTWSAGPTSCEFFQKHNPAGCDGCPHREKDGSFKYTSPITLGRTMPELETETVEVEVEQDGMKVMVMVPPKPEGFAWEGGKMVRYITDHDGIVQCFNFSDSHFYLTHWIEEDGSIRAGARQHLPRGGISDFELPTKCFSSAAKAVEELGDKGIMVTHNKDAGAHLTAYLRDSLAKIKTEADQFNTMRSLGWNKDFSGFLIGDRLFHQDGTVRKVLLGGMAQGADKTFPEPKAGSLVGYVEAVNEVYAREGMEPMQYAFCNAFGSLLTPFSTEPLYRGVLFAVTGAATAKGKTTVAHAALYGFGEARNMTHTKTTTINARYATMGVHNHLSLLFDEFTDIKPEELSEWAYATSEGREKTRMSATAKNGLKLTQPNEWSMSPFVTANTDLHGRLAQYRLNTQAESVRIVQINIDQFALPQLQPTKVAAALTRMSLNQGHAGAAFISYVVGHLNDVTKLVGEIAADMAVNLPGVEYRYFRAHAACTLAAAKLLVDLGLVAFDYDVLYQFAIKLMQDMAVSVAETNVVTLEDAIHNMITDLSPDIFQTADYGDGRRGVKTEVRLRGKPVGRYVVGTPQTPKKFAQKIYITKDALEAWCAENRVDPKDLRREAHALGLLPSNVAEKFNISCGTTLAPSRPYCLCFDADKLGGITQLEIVHDEAVA
jgi:hypothetical protein